MLSLPGVCSTSSHQTAQVRAILLIRIKIVDCLWQDYWLAPGLAAASASRAPPRMPSIA
jgi:hypothetical protein